jgi:Glycosyl hydrolase family 62
MIRTTTIALLLFGQPLTLVAADDVEPPLTGPLATGNFSWTASQPLVSPVDHDGDHCYSVKDPSIVRYNQRWHLFTTIRSKQRTHQIEYRSFRKWADADSVQPQLLNLTTGYYCAPQVFYFAPQKKWYLIHQVLDRSRSPSLQPAYCTTDNLADASSWSKATLLFDEHPGNVKMWIDFWVICDKQKAHLFFTSHAGWMWRSETPLDQFPSGFSKPKVVLRGDIFEASHTYRLKGQNRFLTLVEAQKDGRRYLKAYTAERLDGQWSPLAATIETPLASLRNVRFEGEQWTDSISHPEFLRTGFDQNLEIDPDDLKILFQGTTSKTGANGKYGEIPWRLGLLVLDNRPE